MKAYPQNISSKISAEFVKESMRYSLIKVITTNTNKYSSDSFRALGSQ